MDVFKMVYESLPDVSSKFAPGLSEIDTDKLRLNLIPPCDSTNSKKVTFADFPEESDVVGQPHTADTSRIRHLDELRNALGRHRLTERGISYLTPVNQSRISVDNVFKPRLSEVFDKDVPKKDASLFNHCRGETSPRDTPRLCRDISEVRVTGGNFLSPRDEEVPPEFSLTKRYVPKDTNQHVDSLAGVDILLPGSSIPTRRLRRTTMTVAPRIKELLESFLKHADVTEDMDGVPPTRESYRKTRHRENVRIQLPNVMGDEQKREILNWLDKDNTAVLRK